MNPSRIEKSVQSLWGKGYLGPKRPHVFSGLFIAPAVGPETGPWPISMTLHMSISDLAGLSNVIREISPDMYTNGLVIRLNQDVRRTKHPVSDTTAYGSSQNLCFIGTCAEFWDRSGETL